jgi:UDP-glucose 4-epimerase
MSTEPYFRDRPVLVIGGLGFIGVNLTARLAAMGARLTVLTPVRARHTAQADAFERQGVRIVEGDLRDAGLTRALVPGQDLVINLSGQSGAVRSMEDPWTDLDMNLRGTLTVLEAIRDLNAMAKYVTVGSRLQYGKPTRLPASENDLGAPLCLHAIHKRTIEDYLHLYGHLFGLRYVIARVTNPYGPGQPSGRTAYGVINRMIHLAIAGQPIPIYGDGTQRRDYIHVDDVVNALLALAQSPSAEGGTFNVGTGHGIGLLEVATHVIEIAGAGTISHVEWPPLAAQIETGDFVADISRIRSEIGWSPAIGLREGLSQTVAFYRSHP